MSISVFWDVTLRSMIVLLPEHLHKIATGLQRSTVSHVRVLQFQVWEPVRISNSFFTFFEGHIDSTLWNVSLLSGKQKLY